MKSRFNNFFGPEKKIAKTRVLLKEGQFETAVAESKELIKSWPERHEGWRLLIESSAKGKNSIEENLTYFFLADLKEKLEGDAAPKQAYHIITSILSVSRNVELSERLNFRTTDISTKADNEGRTREFLVQVEGALRDIKSIIPDEMCKALGLELAQLVDRPDGKDLELWRRLFEAALQRTNALESVPGFGVRNATSGLLILRYLLSADGVRDREFWGKLTRDIMSELAHKVGPDASLADPNFMRGVGLERGYFPYAIDIKFRALSALVSPLQTRYISSVEARFVEQQLEEEARLKARQAADKQRALDIKLAAEKLEGQRREAESALAEKRRLDAEKEKAEVKQRAAEEAAKRALVSVAAKESKLDADALFKQGCYSEALNLYLDKFAEKVTDKRTFDQIVKCFVGVDPETAAENIETTLGPLIATQKHNSLQLFHLANAIAGVKKEGRIFRSPERLQAEDFISSGLRANIKQYPLWQEKFLIDINRCNFKGAANTLAGIQKAFPGAPEVPALESVLAKFQGRLDEAVEFGLIAKSHPNMKNVSGILKYIDALYARGQIAAAERQMVEGFALAPTNGELISKRLEALVNLGALHSAAEFASSKNVGFPFIPEKFRETQWTKTKSRAIVLRDKDAAPVKSKYSISEEMKTSEIADLVEGSKFEWFIFSRTHLSRAQQDSLGSEMRRSVGLTYFAAPDDNRLETRPDIYAASAIAIRREDLLNYIKAERSQSIIKVLSKAANGLTTQYVPSTVSRRSTLLGLRKPRRVKQKIFADLSLKDSITSKASADLAVKINWVESASMFGRITQLADAPFVLNVKCWDPESDLGRYSRPIIFCASDLTAKDLRDISNNPELKEAWALQFAKATSIVTTKKSVALWLEDTFRIAVPVHRSLAAGIQRAMNFNECKFVVNVGAGIGNILQATPLIRWLSERLDQPIDVCIHSSVGIAHELFGECKYINLAYHSTDIFGGRHYDKAFCASTFGADAKGIVADQMFNQRKVYDFYGQTQTVSEAKYHFFGIWNLEGTRDEVQNVSIDPFVRSHIKPPSHVRKIKDVSESKVGIAGGKRGVLWGKRQWSQFDQLAQALSDQGAEIHSFGGPGEEIAGYIDHTQSKLRDSIKQIRGMDVFVCSDGGAFHMADALKIPTVCIFGPTSVIKNGPMSGATSVILTERACSPCQFRPEFTSCETALCMRDISIETVKDEVFGKLENAYGWCGHPYSRAVQMEFDRQSVLVREAYSDVFFKNSFSLYKYFNPSWEYVFNSVVREHRMDRAEEIIKWAIQHEKCITDDIRYARARAAYIGRKYKLCISYAENDYDRVARPWLLKNLLFRSLLSERSFGKIIELWMSWDGTNCEDVEKDRNAWVETATCALRALATQGSYETELLKLKLRLESIIGEDLNKFKDTRGYLQQLDNSFYRSPEKQFSKAPKRKVTFAIVDNWSRSPKCLRSYNQDIGVYALYENEVDKLDLADVDFILKLATSEPDPDPDSDLNAETGSQLESNPSSASVSNEETGLTESNSALSNFPPTFKSTFRLTDGKGQLWDVWSKDEETDQSKPETFEALVSSYGVDLAEPRAERIMVVAHHHLEKHNPRGGERSTAAIIERLKAQGYEVITVVDHKKTKEYGLDGSSDLSDYILYGPFAFSSGLSAAITCWRPDIVLTYGGVALRAAPICVEHDIPYIFFPRDWGEVCPRPHLNLVERRPILNPKNTYKYTYDHAAKVITNAKYVGEVIKNIYDSESINTYVPVKPPLDPASIKPLSQRKEILLINARKFLGGELVREVATLRPNLEFRVIGGDGLPFPDNVRVEPFFNGHDYTEMYEKTGLFLFPLGDDDPCGTGRVVFEALMSQTPVLSLDRGGMKEVLPKDWLLSNNTSEAWAAAIDKMIARSFDKKYFENLVSVFDYRQQLDIVDKTVQAVLQTTK